MLKIIYYLFYKKIEKKNEMKEFMVEEKFSDVLTYK